MAWYAENTTVAAEKSRAQIEVLIRRYRAAGFVSGYDGRRAFVLFRLADRQIRFDLQLPDATDSMFARVPGRRRQQKVEQEERRLWRSLLLVIKSKLESTESGIETVEEAFLAQTVMGDGTTVGQWAAEHLPEALSAGVLPNQPALTWKGDVKPHESQQS